jgi:hypothetical protein
LIAKTMAYRMKNLRKSVYPRAAFWARGTEKSLRASDIILGMMLVMLLVVLVALLLTRLCAAL